VRVVADARQQAREALACLNAAGSNSDEVALGTADDEVGGELVRALAEAGWPAFQPAAVTPAGGWRGFLTCWRRWLEDPSFAAMADLLGYPQSACLFATGRERLAFRLAELRADWMIQHPEDLARRLADAAFRSDAARASAQAVLDAAGALETWRRRFADEGFAVALGGLLDKVLAADPPEPEAGEAMVEWLVEAAPLITRVRRGPACWLDLMLAALPVPSPVPPAERVVDVQGWLELLYEPGPHLVLCGMNDGRVPARGGSDDVRNHLHINPYPNTAAPGQNPNGSIDDVAGVVSERGNVVGLMPHPEHAVEALIGSTDGALILGSMLDAAHRNALAVA